MSDTLSRETGKGGKKRRTKPEKAATDSASQPSQPKRRRTSSHSDTSSEGKPEPGSPLDILVSSATSAAPVSNKARAPAHTSGGPKRSQDALAAAASLLCFDSADTDGSPNNGSASAARIVLADEMSTTCCNKCCRRHSPVAPGLVAKPASRGGKLHSIPLAFKVVSGDQHAPKRVCTACYTWVRRHFHLYRGDAAAAHHKKCGMGRRTMHCDKMLQGFLAAGVQFLPDPSSPLADTAAAVASTATHGHVGAIWGGGARVASSWSRPAGPTVTPRGGHKARVAVSDACVGPCDEAGFVPTPACGAHTLAAEFVTLRAPVQVDGEEVTNVQGMVDRAEAFLARAKDYMRRVATTQRGHGTAPVVGAGAGGPRNCAAAGSAWLPPMEGHGFVSAAPAPAPSAQPSAAAPPSSAAMEGLVNQLRSRVLTLEALVRMQTRVIRHVATGSGPQSAAGAMTAPHQAGASLKPLAPPPGYPMFGYAGMYGDHQQQQSQQQQQETHQQQQEQQQQQALQHQALQQHIRNNMLMQQLQHQQKHQQQHQQQQHHQQQHQQQHGGMW